MIPLCRQPLCRQEPARHGAGHQLPGAVPTLHMRAFCVRTAVSCRSVREQKDPSCSSSMDEAGEYLHTQADTSGPIFGLLDWLSNAAFGFGQGKLGEAYKQWLEQQWRTPEQRRSARLAEADAKRRAAIAAAVAAQPEAVAGLSALLFIPQQRVEELVDRYPQLLSIPPADIAQRLLAFKQLLPWTDVVHMVEIHPQLLGVEAGFVLTVVRRRIQLLKEGMRGADLATMVQEHPWVLLDDLEVALPSLHELWPGLDEEAFGNSNPAELACALRALSKTGPPRRY